MQNPIQKFRQSSIVFEEPVIFSEKWKTFNELQLPWCWIFFAETSHASPTYECLKKGVRDFLILFRSRVICKNEKDLASIHSFFTFLLVTRDLYKRKKKSQTRFCWHCYVATVYKILNSVVAGACQSFQFFS